MDIDDKRGVVEIIFSLDVEIADIDAVRISNASRCFVYIS